MTKEIDVASHEAGHTVAALVFGIPIRSVSVRPKEDHAGISRLDGRGAEEMHGAIVLVAGSLAEKKALGHLPRFNWFWDDHDAEAARELVDVMAARDGLDVYDFRRLVELKARSLLTARWSGVQALATALERHTVLTGDEAARTVKPFMKKGDGDGHLRTQLAEVDRQIAEIKAQLDQPNDDPSLWPLRKQLVGLNNKRREILDQLEGGTHR